MQVTSLSDQPSDSAVVSEYGITPRERDYSASLYAEIVKAAKLDKDQFKQMKAWREYLRGKIKDDLVDPNEIDDDCDNKVRANLLHSRFSSQMSRIVARNPECSVAPAPRVDEESYSNLRTFTQTAEIYLNHEIKTGNIKKQLKKQTRSTKECSTGWIKVFYQENYWTDPLVQYRNDDAQDNIARLQAKLAAFESSEIDLTPEEQNALMGEINTLQAGIEESVEIKISEGFTYRKLHSDDVIVSPDVEEMCDYADSEWITTRIFMPLEEAKARFNLHSDEDVRRLQQARTYKDNADKEESEPSDGGSTRAASTDTKSPTSSGNDNKNTKLDGDVCVFEMQHKGHRTVYTFIEGMIGFARPPQRPKHTSSHWYDLFLLAFNDTDRHRFPLSDVELGSPLVDEYNQTRSDLREHRNSVVPIRIAKADEVTTDDVKKINDARVNEVVTVKGSDNPEIPVSNSITQLQYSQLDPALYDVTPARQDLDQVLGSPDLDAGVQIGDRTATAASIQNEGMQSRTTAKQDAIEDMVTLICEHMLQIALQRVSYQQIVQICGDGAVWPGYQPQIDPIELQQAALHSIQTGQPFTPPQDKNNWINDLTRDEIYSLCMVEVRGGSSGKPNKQMEQQQWMQFFPVFKESIATIAQYRMQGLNDLATAETEILKEFLRRMDEKIDVERFLPSMSLMPPMPLGQPPEASMGGQGGEPASPVGIPLPQLA